LSIPVFVLGLVLIGPFVALLYAMTGDSGGLWLPLMETVFPRYVGNTVALMAGTMTGIVITNLTILTTWWTNPRMRLITSSPRHADNIWNQLKTVIWLLLATAMISLAARQIDTDSDPSPWVAWPFWIASVATLLNFVRFIRTMIGIATIIRNPPSSRDDRAES